MSDLKTVDLRSKAMLAVFASGKPGNTKQDQDLSNAIEKEFKMSRGTGKGSKTLLPSDGILLEIGRVIASFRAEYKKRTLPWYGGEDNSKSAGDIVPVGRRDGETEGNLQALQTSFDQHKDRFDLLVRQFLSNYDRLKREAKSMLGGAFKDGDYLSAEEIAGRFKFSLTITPLPNAEDFRLGLSEAQADKLRAQYLKETQARTVLATKDLARRVQDALGAVKGAIERKEGGKGRLHESILIALGEVGDLIPALNLTDDPALAEAHKRIKSLALVHGDLTAEGEAGGKARAAAAEGLKAAEDLLAGLV